jgi:hypothetical protein
MATWLHDDDTLRYLSEENGPIREWAAFHLLARGRSQHVPTHPLYASVAALLGDVEADTWGRAALADPGVLPDLLLLARFTEVRPTDPAAWTEPLVAALAGPHGAEAADLLTVLGQLSVAHLPVLVERHPASTTWLAWLASVDTPHDLTAEIAQRIRADRAADGPELVDSVTLLTHPCTQPFRKAYEAFLAGCHDAGVPNPALVRGSVHHRVRRGIAAASASLCPAARTLVTVANELDDGVPPAVAYAVARSQSDRPSDLTVPGHPAYALQVASEVVVAPDQVPELLREDRSLGLRVARFVPTTEVLEALLGLPVPAEADARVDLALALAMMAVPSVQTTLRGVVAHVERGPRRFVEQIYADLCGTPL